MWKLQEINCLICIFSLCRQGAGGRRCVCVAGERFALGEGTPEIFSSVSTLCHFAKAFGEWMGFLLKCIKPRNSSDINSLACWWEEDSSLWGTSGCAVARPGRHRFVALKGADCPHWIPNLTGTWQVSYCCPEASQAYRSYFSFNLWIS